MKKTLIILLSLTSIFTFAGQHEEDSREKSTPEYYVSKNVLDNTLPKTEAVFTFCFSAAVYDSGYAHQNKIQTEIKYSYNGVNKTVKPDADGRTSLKVKPGKYVFKFWYTQNYFEITTDSIAIKPRYKSEVQVNFHSSEVIEVSDKPVIYVYPKESTQVKITMDLKGEFSFTYPEYNKGWNFIADPNGTLHMGDKKYDYLFWDGKLKMNANNFNWNEGFDVKKDDLVKFFEDKLSQMGLNAREINDYITYWVPRMNVNEINYVHFIFNEEYDQYAHLNVTPKPDKVFRVYMMWSKSDGLEEMLSLIPQKLPSFTRDGFTVVEWGGTEMNEMPVSPTLGTDDDK